MIHCCMFQIEDPDTKAKKPDKSLNDVVERFVAATSVQGIPFINRSTLWYAKFIWTLIFLGAVSGWLYHSYTLIDSFAAYETTTRVRNV